jgi:gas vesicle protein
MDNNDSNFGSFLAGFIFGGLVGAATAIILAPQSGRATRKQIADITNEMRDESMERFESARGMADTYAREYRDMAESMAADTRERVQSLGDQVQEQARIVLDNGKDEVVADTGNGNGES